MNHIQLDFLAHADFSGRARRNKTGPGYGVFQTAVDNLRRENPAGTLLLDAGDAFNTTFWGGAPMVRAVSLAGTAVMTLGNHEFDKGEEALLENIRLADFPILCANVTRKADGQSIPGAKPWILLENQGVKIGILGVTTEYTPYMVTATSWAPFEIHSCAQACRKYIPEMRAAGAEVTVLLAHIPFYIEDGVISGELVDLLQEIPAVDIAIGGHIPGDYAGLWKDTLVLKGGFGGVSLPHARLTLDEHRHIVKKEAWVHLTDWNLEPRDPWAAYEKEVTGAYDDFFTKPLCHARELWTMRLAVECQLGNFLSGCVQEAAGVDFAYMNTTSSGGAIQPGPVTAEDVTDVMGFNDPILTSTMTGREIRQLFETVYVPERFGNNAALMYSGVVVYADHTKPAGEKILRVTDRAGIDLDPEKEYTVATSEYMSTGGNDTGVLAKARAWTPLGMKMYDAIFASIEQHGCLFVSGEQRMHAIGHPENDNAPF